EDRVTTWPIVGSHTVTTNMGAFSETPAGVLIHLAIDGSDSQLGNQSDEEIDMDGMNRKLSMLGVAGSESDDDDSTEESEEEESEEEEEEKPRSPLARVARHFNFSNKKKGKKKNVPSKVRAGGNGSGTSPMSIDSTISSISQRSSTKKKKIVSGRGKKKGALLSAIPSPRAHFLGSASPSPPSAVRSTRSSTKKAKKDAAAAAAAAANKSKNTTTKKSKKVKKAAADAKEERFRLLHEDRIIKNEGQGNCLYLAAAILPTTAGRNLDLDNGQLRSEATTLRKLTCNEMKKNPSVYSPFYEGGLEEMLSDVKDQRKPGSWSTDIHVFGLSNAIKTPITLHTVDHPDGQTYGHEHKGEPIDIRYLGNHFERIMLPSTGKSDPTNSTSSPNVSDASSDADKDAENEEYYSAEDEGVDGDEDEDKTTDDSDSESDDKDSSDSEEPEVGS
ncbi:hypothetical protein THAOC_16581, partial [Thalassiosira oceanica]